MIAPAGFAPAAPTIGRPALPPGRPVELPGRGTTFVHELPGPPGAPTVVLLHGWTVTAGLNWASQFAPLAERARVVALDHRGHGRGIRARRRFRLEDAVDDVVALADVLEVERPVLVGYSMGGVLAQLAWRRHPDRVAGLVLCATWAHPADAARERLGLRALGGLGTALRLAPRRRQVDVLTAVADRFSTAGRRSPWILAEVRRGSVPAVFEAGAALARHDASPWLGDVDVPVGVLVTGRDVIVDPGRQHRLVSLLPRARSRTVPLDHDAVVADPAAFTPAFLDLVDGVLAEPGGCGR